MNKYTWIKPYINEQYNKFYENNVIKSRLLEYDFLRAIDYLYDDMIDYIYDCFMGVNCLVCNNIIQKFVGFLDNVNDEIRGMYYGEKYDKNHDTCISITYETEFGVVAQKHVCNTSRENAHSYMKHFRKLNGDLWNDYNQTGLYCNVVSRNYCMNHDDFEHDYMDEYIHPDCMKYNI